MHFPPVYIGTFIHTYIHGQQANKPRTPPKEEKEPQESHPWRHISNINITAAHSIQCNRPDTWVANKPKEKETQESRPSMYISNINTITAPRTGKISMMIVSVVVEYQISDIRHQQPENLTESIRHYPPPVRFSLHKELPPPPPPVLRCLTTYLLMVHCSLANPSIRAILL